MQKNSKARVEGKLCPEPHGADCPIPHPAPEVESYPLPLGHHGIKQQRNPRPGRWPSEMPWNPPSPPPCPGRIGCRRRKNRRDIPLRKANPTWAHLPHHWRVITLVMSPWSMTVFSNVTPTWSLRMRAWKQMYCLTLLPLCL